VEEIAVKWHEYIYEPVRLLTFHTNKIEISDLVVEVGVLAKIDLTKSTTSSPTMIFIPLDCNFPMKHRTAHGSVPDPFLASA